MNITRKKTLWRKKHEIQCLFNNIGTDMFPFSHRTYTHCVWTLKLDYAWVLFPRQSLHVYTSRLIISSRLRFGAFFKDVHNSNSLSSLLGASFERFFSCTIVVHFGLKNLYRVNRGIREFIVPFTRSTPKRKGMCTLYGSVMRIIHFGHMFTPRTFLRYVLDMPEDVNNSRVMKGCELLPMYESPFVLCCMKHYRLQISMQVLDVWPESSSRIGCYGTAYKTKGDLRHSIFSGRLALLQDLT